MSNGASDTSSVGSSKDRSIGGDKKTNEQDSHHQQAEHENKSSTTKHKKHTHTKIDERKKRRLIANFDPTRQHEIRESNRVAARVCRKRKKQFSQSLEATLKVLGEENQLLTAQHDTLSSWVKMVRQEATTPANTTVTGLDTQERTETVGSVQEETGAGQLPKLVSNDTSSSSAQQDRNGNNVSNGSNGNNGNNGNSSGNNGNTTIDTSDNNVMPQVVLPIPVYNTASFQNAMYDNSLYPQTSFLQQPMSSSQDRSIFTPLQQQQQQHHHQQQQQQNFFQQNLFPGGAFGTNTTNALPISMMMQMQNYSGMPGTLFPNNGRQMSNMMPSMVGLPPLTAPARDSSNIAYMQQGLSALMGNQQYPLGVSQSNQNPNFMQQGGWNAGMTTTPRSRPLQQQQDTAVPNEVGNGSQQEQQPNPDFSSNNFSHYQQI